MTATNDRATTTRKAGVQLGALVVGVVFLLVGIAGFIPGITTGYSTMSFASHTSGAHLLGFFQVSILHNAVHLLFGVAGVLLSRRALSARNYLFYGGIIYGVLFLYGIVVPSMSAANFVPVNDADNFLHLVLAAGMIGLSLVLGRGPAEEKIGPQQSARG
jgi:hypothetical protein